MNRIIGFVKEFTREKIPELSNVERIGRQYYYLEKELKKTKDSLKEKQKLEPYSAGLFFGELKDGKFKPGFPLLDIIAKHTPRKAVINKKGETLFLYKNSLTEESMITGLRGKGYVLVLNEAGDVLGYGELKQDRGRTIITNELNRSDFLKREEQRRK